MFYHGANDWWNLPRTRAQQAHPPNEGPLGQMPARIMRLLNAATSGDHHATPWFYAWVGVILAIITLAEVWIFTFETLGPWFVPLLLILSLLKFIMVVAFFMHLRFDNKLFAWIFGPASQSAWPFSWRSWRFSSNSTADLTGCAPRIPA